MNKNDLVPPMGIIIVAMMLFGAFFTFINHQGERVTWSGIDLLQTQNRYIEKLIKDNVKPDTVIVHDTIYLPLKEINNVQD